MNFVFKLKSSTTHSSAGYLLLSLLLVLCFASQACQRKPEATAAATGRRYEVKGKVVRVDKEKHRVTLDHEEIPGYMEAMIMPYTLKDEQILNELAPGDQLQATLIVDADSSWLEDVVFTRTSPAASGANGSVATSEPKPGDAVPNFSLVNQDAKSIRMNGYRGKALLLTFIYTRCPLPEYCTLMSNNFAAIEKELQTDAALYEKTHLLSISFDPAYDTPKVLKSYGAAHTGNFKKETFEHWEFATAKPDQVKEIAQFFGLTYMQESDQIVHSLKTAIIAPDGRVYKLYSGNDWKPEEVLSDLRTLLNSNAK
ncbi:MAG TPA: SCO family protein [Pyrinomonadaceae bacterium]|nr:SCO family protein [Pyrinomonadaceae bacterium]